jgi:hypothetical protein
MQPLLQDTRWACLPVSSRSARRNQAGFHAVLAWLASRISTARPQPARLVEDPGVIEGFSEVPVACHAVAYA